MNTSFYLVRPILFGFEASLFACAPNPESVKIYFENILKDTPLNIMKISEDDFRVFAMSGFKFYMVPDLTSNTDTSQEQDKQEEVLLDDVIG